MAQVLEYQQNARKVFCRCDRGDLQSGKQQTRPRPHATTAAWPPNRRLTGQNAGSTLAHVSPNNPNPALSISTALAPAAGSGIGRMLFTQLLEDSEFVGEMKAAVMKGLRAQHTFRDRKSGEIITADDPRTMIATVAMILAQAEGDPIKRVIHQHIGAPGAVDVQQELRDSDALRQAVRRELEKAEFRGRHGRREDLDIVDVA